MKKIYIDRRDDYLRGVTRHVELQGDVITPELDDADFVLSSPLPLMNEIVSLMGYTVHTVSPTHGLSRFWTGECFEEQNMLSIYVRGHMNNDLGADVPVAVGTRFIRESKMIDFLCNDKLYDVLKAQTYKGFVTSLFNEDRFCGIVLGLPFWSQYTMLETIRENIVDWHSNASHRPMYESWIVANLISVFPYPAAMRTVDKTVLHLPKKLERHFYLMTNEEPFKEVVVTNDTVVGIATGWSAQAKLNEAADYALRTGFELKGKTPNIQFRTDLVSAIASGYQTVLDSWPSANSITSQ